MSAEASERRRALVAERARVATDAAVTRRRVVNGVARRCALVALLAGSLAACASSGSKRADATAAGPALRGSFFALSVADVDRIASWYVDNLGFTVDRRGQAPNAPVKFAMLSRDGAVLEVLQLASAKSRADWGLPAEAREVHGILKLGFIVGDVDALFAHAQARQLDVFFPLVDAKDVPMRTFGLKDPEGNIVQFFGL